MASRYLIYRTDFNDTVVRESPVSGTTGVDEGELYTDFLIPAIQPLYYWKVDTDNTLVLPNSEYWIGEWENYISPATPNDFATLGELTGATTQLQNDIDYLSGVTDTKLLISTFSVYTGNTETELDYIDADLTYLSGQTDTKLNISSFNTYSGNTANEINNRLLASIFNTFTGTTLPADYASNAKFNTYTGATGLQQVTEIGASTDVETTFENGLVINKFRPAVDGYSAITLNNADSTAVLINIDSISGLTGFNKVNPIKTIDIWGTDESGTFEEENTQTNGIRIDGSVDSDKDIVWADNGIDKWLAEIYRGEEGRYWYLYNEEGEMSPLTVSESGRIGINSITNIIDYGAQTISGTTYDYNKLKIGGVFDKNFVTVYEVQINSVTGNPNTYIWRKSTDLGFTFGSWSTPTGCTTGTTILDSGIEISFVITTGFTLNAKYKFTAFPQLAPATLSVTGNRVNVVLVAQDYSADPVAFLDVTANANTSSIGNSLPLFRTGTTLNAAYIGTPTKLSGLFLNVISAGAGITLVVEYWNGSTWVDISVGSEYYLDTTSQLTQTGSISWDITRMTGWIKDNITEYLPDVEFYWLRIRTSSPATVEPLIGGLARATDKRFSVFSSALDEKPSFYVDAIGRVNVGGGNITGRNLLQININKNYLCYVGSSSLFEIDNEDSTIASTIKIKQATNDGSGPSILFTANRGTLDSLVTPQYDDNMGCIAWGSVVNGNPSNLAKIIGKYVGDGTTYYGDLRFEIADGVALTPVERMRITNGGVGFNMTNPSAYVHIQSGTTSIAPLKFVSGSLLSSPQAGAIEYNGSAYYGTTGSTRKTFAFLESPHFSGNVYLPTTTCLDGANLCTYILNSGGTNNSALVQKSDYIAYTGATNTRLNGIDADIDYISGITNTKLPISTFATYTGGTIPWTKVDKTGSSLADFATRDSADVSYINANWSVTNVDNMLGDVGDYIENTQITGRISPVDVLFGRLTNTLIVSGGTGYINYNGYHKKITWSGTTFDTSTGYTEITYYVYVDTNSQVLISSSLPNNTENIILGSFFWGGLIGVIQQNGIYAKSAMNGIIDSLTRQGIFIYDNGGKIELMAGNNLKIASSAAKIQYGTLSSQLPARNSNDATGYTYLNYYNSADYGWAVNYYFSIITQGLTPVNRWNDITKNSGDIVSGHSITFTYGSNIVTGTTGFTTSGLTNAFIYSTGDKVDVFMTPVSAVTISGSTVIITLETPYYGTGATGNMVVISALPRIPAGKYAKNLIARSSDGLMYYILAQTYYNTKDEAKLGVLPAVPLSLQSVEIKMAYIITYSGQTSLSGDIYDIRPLPYSLREGGQAGGGAAITSHGSLTGLDADDHLQYLRTDGTRNLTGIQRYQSHPTFTTNLDLVDKCYVDSCDALKLSISAFNTYSGTTVPATYKTISSVNSYTGATQAIFTNTLEPTGFINNQNIYATYDSVNRTITLSAITGTVDYYWRGVKHTLGTSWTSGAHTDDTTAWYLSTADGINFGWSNTSWSFDHVQVALRPAHTTWALREVHGTMEHSTHDELHRVVGTYRQSGFGLTVGTYALQPAIPTDADNTPAFDSGIIVDEDVKNSIAAWNQDSYTLLYFSGTSAPVFVTGQTSMFTIGTTYPNYNAYSSGGTFSNVEMLPNHFANLYVVRIPVTSDAGSQQYRAVVFQPQFQYATLVAAQGENTQKIELGGLSGLSPEFVLVERITIGTKANYSGATGNVRIEAAGILSTTRFGQVGSTADVISVTAENVIVTPVSPFTSSDMQNLSNEFAYAISARLLTSTFSGFTGTTLPANYYNKIEINAYTGATKVILDSKADLSGGTFTGAIYAPTAIINTSTTQVATTAFVTGQAATAQPLMNGTNAIGTSLQYARQDHVHPSDTSRVSTTNFDTFTGTTLPANYYNKTQINAYTGATDTRIATIETHYVSGATNLDTGVGIYSAKSGKDLQFKSLSGGTNITLSEINNVIRIDSTDTCAIWGNITGSIINQSDLYNCLNSKVAKTGDTMTGKLTINSSLYVTGTTCLNTLSTGSISTDDTLMWNSTSKAITAFKLTGGSDSYHYAERATTVTTTSATPTAYLTYTNSNFLAGRYSVDFSLINGNASSNSCTVVAFVIDGSTQGQSTFNRATNSAGQTWTSSLSRDITLTAGSHTLRIDFNAGGGKACAVLGTIRAKRIC